MTDIAHMMFETCRVAAENNISIVCPPPYTSHALKPFDVGVYGPAKAEWKAIIRKYYRESRQQSLRKTAFPPLLKELFEGQNKKTFLTQ